MQAWRSLSGPKRVHGAFGELKVQCRRERSFCSGWAWLATQVGNPGVNLV